MSKCININDNQFDTEVLQHKNIVLTDFWAPGCGPCKMINPILEQISEHYGNKLKIVKINIDKNKITASKYNVRGIPTLMIFKDGENVETKIGAIQQYQLISIIDKHL